MKNPVIIFVVVIIFIIAVFGIYSFSQKSSLQSDSQMKKDNVSVQEGEKVQREEDVSRYIEYSKSALDQAGNQKRVLFFYANWCPTCRPADANFKQNESKIPEDAALIRVNYNDTDTDQEEKDLAKKYEITYQHTFVQIDSQGKEIAKWNGGQIEEFLTNIK